MDEPRAAVFLDRDGTLNVEVEYLSRSEDVQWIPGAREAVRSLNEAGLLVIVVTNQAGVAHGYFTEDQVRALHRWMDDELRETAGAHVDAWHYCPHHPEGRVAAYRRVCADRKPGPGLFERAIAEWHIDPTRSFVVGDKNSDLEPGSALGMTTLLVQTGYGPEERKTTRADRVVTDIRQAADVILELWTTTR